MGFWSIEIGKKVLQAFDNVFHVYLMSGLQKYAKKYFFTMAFLVKSTLSLLRYTWTGWINLKILLGYNINYLSKGLLAIQIQIQAVCSER